MVASNIFWTYNQGVFAINVPAAVIALLSIGLLVVLWRENRTGKLDWTDMITSRQKKVSLTKLLQLVGGITGTWIMVFTTLSGKITGELLMIYLTYVGAIEGWSKFVAAKYQYSAPDDRDSDNRNTR